MDSQQLVPSLMLFTLGAVFLIAVGSFAWFLRKRRNRQLAVKAFEGDKKI